MFYDRLLKRRKNHTVIPIHDMITAEGVIFFGEDPGIIGAEVPYYTELDHISANLSE